MRSRTVVWFVCAAACSGSSNDGDGGPPLRADASDVESSTRDGAAIPDALPPHTPRVHWAKVIRGACGSEDHVSLAPLTDGGFVLGACGLNIAGVSAPAGETGTVGVARFDGQGRAIWLHRFGTEGPIFGLEAVRTDAHDGIVMGGLFYDTIDFGGGPLRTPINTDEVFVAKLDPSGGHVWSKQFGGYARDEIHSLALFGDGRVIFSGMLDRKGATFGKVVLNAASGCLTDRYVAELQSDGETEWAECFTEVDRATSDADGHVFVAEGTGVAELGPLGSKTRAWTHPFDGFTWAPRNQDQIRAMSIDGDGSLVLTGRIGGGETHQGDMPRIDGFDLLAARLRPSGELVFMRRIPSSGDAEVFRAPEIRGESLALGPMGDVWIAGLFAGSVDFGGGAITGGGDAISGHDEGFIAQLDRNGDHLQSFRVGAPIDSIIRLPDGSLVIAGHFWLNAQIGDVLLKSEPDFRAIFVARLVP